MTRLSEPAVRRARSAVSVAVGAAAVLALAPAAASADPSDDEPSIEELNDRAEDLEEQYDSELVQYTDAKDAAEEADEELEDVNKRIEEARGEVAELAAQRYKGTGVDPTVEVVMNNDPDQMFDDAAIVSHLSENNGKRLDQLTELKKDREEAAEKAQGKLEDAEELVDELESKRDEVQEKIDRYEEEEVPDGTGGGNDDSGDSGGPGDGSIPADAKGPGWDGATPRMAGIRDEIVREFGAPYPVGCLRPGDNSGEHGSGRACDFMMSSGGATPSAQHQQLGQEIANYAQSNADRLGVMYIIWEQKIWDTRNPGAGWKPMDDRGGTTANHYDHVHISSY
ncbi:hypothetical protein FHX37_2697 [Haloactinospora alba]|uniref:ARB-07466-like C-terminal domain-containing protein n=1 Tax=Haloactinospora alba TaxID=405555 RepID=A0A543NLN3_9ACTN|nr:hypothetical protein [Haloactinospora alba]TQN32719.1 hypothetical protein FHX37_2697 [Haloactinospora alba]